MDTIAKSLVGWASGVLNKALAPEMLSDFQGLLADLRAMRLVHHTAHLQSSGSAAFSDHLMFKGLYEKIDDEIDGLAEKMVASYGADAVAAEKGAEEVSKSITGWDKLPGEPWEKCLHAEKAIQGAISGIMSKGVSEGMANFLQAIADAHETHIYLLQQRGVAKSLDWSGRVLGRSPSLRKAFDDSAAIGRLREWAGDTLEKSLKEGKEPELTIEQATEVAEIALQLRAKDWIKSRTHIAMATPHPISYDCCVIGSASYSDVEQTTPEEFCEKVALREVASLEWDRSRIKIMQHLGTVKKYKEWIVKVLSDTIAAETKKDAPPLGGK